MVVLQPLFLHHRWMTSIDEAEEIERQLRNHLVALMDLSTVAEAETVQRDVVHLTVQVNALDPNVPRQWAVRRLHGYVDWRSRTALENENDWLKREQAPIDRALLTVLDQTRHGQSAVDIGQACEGMDRLSARIAQLEAGADRAAALQCLWDYTDLQSRDALERANLAERQHELRMKHERPAATEIERPVIEEREYPTMEWER